MKLVGVLAGTSVVAILILILLVFGFIAWLMAAVLVATVDALGFLWLRR